MGRPAVHTADSLLDHALELFAADGPRAVTMAAVARAARAPSGSVYHRFADRESLLAAMWRRTASRFEEGYFAALGPEPDPADAVRASVWVVEWCRAHPSEAALLHAGPRALALSGENGGEAHDRHRRELGQRMAALVAAASAAADRPRDEVSFAMYDLPLAVVRQHLDEGRPIPASAADRVRRLATRLLLG